MTLADLREGQSCTIVRIGGQGAIRQRMLDMGITAGSELKVERYAPLLDPVQIKIKGYSLALRVAEARLIEVTDIKS